MPSDTADKLGVGVTAPWDSPAEALREAVSAVPAATYVIPSAEGIALYEGIEHHAGDGSVPQLIDQLHERAIHDARNADDTGDAD